MELLDGQIDPQRLGVMGYGEHRPFSANDTKQNKTLNRRVEIFLSGRPGAAAQQGPGLKAPQK